MSKRKSKKNNKKFLRFLIGVLLIFGLAIFEYYAEIPNQAYGNTELINKDTSDNLKVYFIDVGQADSILITQNNEAMLIDAGNNDDGEQVVNFIKEKGIDKLNYLVGTHPHEDHIGGLDNVINSSIAIDNVLMPKAQTNTKTFEDVLDALVNKKVKVTAPKKGDTFKIGDANCEIMTDSIYDSENLNLSSIVIRLTYGNKSFLFMGDAETKNEMSRDWPNTDVLKVGHHGSKTSSSQKFIEQVKPQYSVIMVGKDNSYGLPKENIIERLTTVKSKIYRTDEEGTITITSDGTEIYIETEK